MSKCCGTRIAAALILSLSFVSTALAGNLGSDFNLTLTPATGAMAGAGYVRPQDPVAAVFGNPATLTQLEGDTAFILGAAFLDVDAHADHDGSVTGEPFKADSDAENYLLPTVGVQQRIGENWVIGGGTTVVAGLGSDFRNATSLEPIVELIVFGANVGVGYEVRPGLSIGASGTLAFGLLEFGLITNTGLTHDFGFRGNAGVTYDTGPVEFGITYTSPLQLNFDSVTEVAPDEFSDIGLEQPQEVIFGIASSPDPWRDVVLELDVIWKNWSGAEGYEDIWEDQFVFALGGQYTFGCWTGRLGYSYATDLQKDQVGDRLGDIESLNIGDTAVPLSPAIVQFVQATLTQPYWQQQIAGGIGVQLLNTLSFDVQAGYAFDGDRRIGGTRLDVNELQVGAGFTWTF